MPDLGEQFHALGDDVTGLPRPPAAELRRRAERRRTTLLATVAGLVIALGLGLGQLLDNDDRQSLEYVQPTASPSPAPASQPERAWLPGPWVLQSSDVYTVAAGTPSRYRFCGESMVSAGPVAVAEQRLVHPAGQRAHLLAFTPEGEDPIQLFKFSYASCVVKGKAESIAGPRNVWSYGTLAGASEVVGDALHLAELTGRTVTHSDAKAALDTWAD